MACWDKAFDKRETRALKVLPSNSPIITLCSVNIYVARNRATTSILGKKSITKDDLRMVVAPHEDVESVSDRGKFTTSTKKKKTLVKKILIWPFSACGLLYLNNPELARIFCSGRFVIISSRPQHHACFRGKFSLFPGVLLSQAMWGCSTYWLFTRHS